MKEAQRIMVRARNTMREVLRIMDIATESLAGLNANRLALAMVKSAEAIELSNTTLKEIVDIEQAIKNEDTRRLREKQELDNARQQATNASRSASALAQRATDTLAQVSERIEKIIELRPRETKIQHEKAMEEASCIVDRIKHVKDQAAQAARIASESFARINENQITVAMFKAAQAIELAKTISDDLSDIERAIESEDARRLCEMQALAVMAARSERKPPLSMAQFQRQQDLAEKIESGMETSVNDVNHELICDCLFENLWGIDENDDLMPSDYAGVLFDVVREHRQKQRWNFSDTVCSSLIGRLLMLMEESWPLYACLDSIRECALG